MKEQLKERYVKLCKRLGIPKEYASENLEYLWSQYESEGRAYHTLTWHISKALKFFDATKSETGLSEKNLEEVEYAIWWHDVVYDGKRHDNEEKSAEIAVVNARPWVNEHSLGRIHDLIMETKHRGLPKKGKLYTMRCFMTDIDLSGFALSPEEFDLNGEKIRKEYAFASDERYAEGRKRFAKKMLKRKHIYALPSNRVWFEARAQANLRRLAGE